MTVTVNRERARAEVVLTTKHAQVWAWRYYGLGQCCDNPHPLKITRRGAKLERCFNCGKEAPRE
jgi:hypothetical protein